MELMGSGVGVLVASPGAVDTGIHGKRLTGHGTMADEGRDFSDKKQMSAERCAELIVGAIQKRCRDLIMTAGGKMAVWLKPFFPGYVDKRVKAAVEDWYAD
jgi:short-subunit dehydrogenase